MGSTNLSGPIKAGTIRYTNGTTVGTDVANVGYVLMGQSAMVVITGATSANQTVATIPAGSQIVDVLLNVTTANADTSTATVSVGTSSSVTAFLPATSVKTAATTHGTLGTTATNVGTTDIQVVAKFTAGTGDSVAGVASVTVLYLQGNSLA